MLLQNHYKTMAYNWIEIMGLFNEMRYVQNCQVLRPSIWKKEFLNSVGVKVNVYVATNPAS